MLEGKQPLFIKGHIKLAVEGQVFEFLYQKISPNGLSGLPGSQKLRQYFGNILNCVIQIPIPNDKVTLQAKAKVLREFTSLAENIALQFELTESQKSKFEHCVAQHGFCPASDLRKYPRIPSQEVIQTFPLRAMVIPITPLEPTETAPIVMDVLNLSPNGVLLKTESPLALPILPNQRLKIVLEPRGWFPVQVEIEGLVCRITEDLNSKNQNLLRLFGIKFTKMSATNKVAFLDLLKDIISQVVPVDRKKEEIHQQ